MLELDTPDLTRHSAAARFVKDEVVNVRFATVDGELTSREGPNRFRAGDALITGSAGERWSVSRNRFDAKYDPVSSTQAGDDGRYRSRPIPVLATQMEEPFSVARTAGGDLLCGAVGDWLVQYAPGDFGIVENQRFRQVYRRHPA